MSDLFAHFGIMRVEVIFERIQQRKSVLKLYSSINPLSTNFTKWSNTLKRFVGNLPTNCLSVFDHFVKLALKGLRKFHDKNAFQSNEKAKFTITKMIGKIHPQTQHSVVQERIHHPSDIRLVNFQLQSVTVFYGTICQEENSCI